MADLVDDITIINRALARIGGGAVQDRTEDSDLARQVFAIFDDTKDWFLSSWNWNFARETRILERLAGVPSNGWVYAFAMPADAIGGPERLLRSAMQSDILRDYAVEGRVVYCNVEALRGAFLIDKALSLWPGDVRAAFTVFLASEFCVPVSEDDDLAAKLRDQAMGSPAQQGSGGMIGRCIANDVMRAGPKSGVQEDDPLTGAHRAGASYYVR